MIHIIILYLVLGGKQELWSVQKQFYYINYGFDKVRMIVDKNDVVFSFKG